MTDTQGVSRERGASAVEYGLLVAAVTCTIIWLMFALAAAISRPAGDLTGQLDGGPGVTQSPPLPHH